MIPLRWYCLFIVGLALLVGLACLLFIGPAPVPVPGFGPVPR